MIRYLSLVTLVLTFQCSVVYANADCASSKEVIYDSKDQPTGRKEVKQKSFTLNKYTWDQAASRCVPAGSEQKCLVTQVTNYSMQKSPCTGASYGESVTSETAYNYSVMNGGWRPLGSAGDASCANDSIVKLKDTQTENTYLANNCLGSGSGLSAGNSKYDNATCRSTPSKSKKTSTLNYAWKTDEAGVSVVAMTQSSSDATTTQFKSDERACPQFRDVETHSSQPEVVRY